MGSATKRKFHSDVEDGGGKLICLESSTDNHSNKMTSHCADDLSLSSVSLRNVIPLAAAALDHQRGVGVIPPATTARDRQLGNGVQPGVDIAWKEHFENKTNSSEQVAAKHIAIQLQAKQLLSVPLNANLESTAHIAPVKEEEENDDNVEKDESSVSSSESSSSSSSKSSSSSESSYESSLLSSWSDNSSQEGVRSLPSLLVQSKYEGLERLEKKLELRKKRLKHLCEGQPPAYVYLLKENEKMAGKIRIAKYLKDNPDEASKVKGHAKGDKHAKGDEASPLLESKTWRGIFQFELIHTLPCAYSVFIICAVHTVFYGFTECSCRILYGTYFIHWNFGKTSFYNCLMLVGLILLRFNGALFYYSTTSMDRHRAKMEMSNRLRVGMFDAVLFKRIKGNIIGSTFSMFGYYLLSIAINYYYTQFYYSWTGEFEKWIGVIWQNSIDLINAEVEEGRKGWAESYKEPEVWAEEYYKLEDPSTSDFKVSPTCIYSADLVPYSFLKPFYIFWCRDPTYEYKSVEIFFHGLSLCIVAFLTSRIGENFMTICD
jgi:hypothetical protein